MNDAPYPTASAHHSTVPIRSLEVSGFKSVRHLSIELARLNVLIGANGSGKSNFIGVFKFLNRVVEGRLTKHVAEGGYAGRFLHFGPKKTSSLSIELGFKEGHYWYGFRLKPDNEGMLVFDREFCGYSDNPGSALREGRATEEVDFDTGRHESRLDEQLGLSIPGNPVWWVKFFLLEFRVYHFHDTSPTSGVRQPTELNNNDFLREDASNLAAFLYKLQRKERPSFRRIVEAVRQVAPYFDDFILAPAELNPKFIHLRWKHRSNDDYFDVASLSDGTLRFICLATLLLQPSLPSVVLLDEPELGLHPSAIVLVAELLRSASTRSQIIVSTQSTTLVNQLRPEEVIVVESQDGASTFRRLTSEGLADWIGDYGLGDLWEKNLLGGRP